jgi:UPF0716 family protein affecting phage T7 exclusion
MVSLVVAVAVVGVVLLIAQGVRTLKRTYDDELDDKE